MSLRGELISYSLVEQFPHFRIITYRREIPVLKGSFTIGIRNFYCLFQTIGSSIDIPFQRVCSGKIVPCFMIVLIIVNDLFKTLDGPGI